MSRFHKRRVGGIIKCELLAGVEHGDAGRELIEHAAMGVGQSRQSASHALSFGCIDTEASAAGLGAEIEHIEAAPGAGDDGRKPARVTAGLGARTRDIVPRRAVEKLKISLDRIGGIARFDRAGVGGVDEVRCPVASRVQTGDGSSSIKARSEATSLSSRSCRSASASSSRLTPLASLRRSTARPAMARPWASIGRPRERGEGHRKCLTAGAQCFNRLLHGGGALRIEPAAEGEHAMRSRERRPAPDRPRWSARRMRPANRP